MGRKVEYFCDECEKVFGDNTHINIKTGDIRMSYRNENMPGGARWVQKKLPLQCRELHFCDGVCLGNYFMKVYDKLLISINKDVQTNQGEER